MQRFTVSAIKLVFHFECENFLSFVSVIFRVFHRGFAQFSTIANGSNDGGGGGGDDADEDDYGGDDDENKKVICCVIDAYQKTMPPKGSKQIRKILKFALPAKSAHIRACDVVQTKARVNLKCVHGNLLFPLLLPQIFFFCFQ